MHIYAYICVTQEKSQSTYLKDIQFYLLTIRDGKPIRRCTRNKSISQQITKNRRQQTSDNSGAFVATESIWIPFVCCKGAYLTINQLLYNYLPPKQKQKQKLKQKQTEKEIINKWNNYH